LKYSEAWKYHVEFEIVISDESEKSKAEDAISAVANELNVELMSDDRLLEFTKGYNKSYNYEPRSSS
jgi:hypothetical protein